MIIEFYKLQASGNDFILIENEKLKMKNEKLKKFAKKYCERKFGVGADGMLVIEPSKPADFKMRIFNSDGSEAEMCGNGARCAGLWAEICREQSRPFPSIKFETKAGIIETTSLVKRGNNYGNVAVKMSKPFGLQPDLPITFAGKTIKANFINTGVPHTVVFVEGLDNIDVAGIGREIRFHKQFQPVGTNVNFVEILKEDRINIRTYERGVETETLACGTGSAAGAVLANYKLFPRNEKINKYKINVGTQSGEVLSVSFSRGNKEINDLWLEGRAYLVFKGQLN